MFLVECILRAMSFAIKTFPMSCAYSAGADATANIRVLMSLSSIVNLKAGEVTESATLAHAWL